MNFLKFFDSFIILFILFLCNKFCVNSSDIHSAHTNSSKYENHLVEDLSSFTISILNDIKYKLKSVPLPLLKNKILSQIVRASDNLNIPNIENEDCEKDYSDFCPLNWTNNGDGMNCLSPLNYNGPCDKTFSFHNATPLAKYNFEKNCNVTWKCIDHCYDQDYSKDCPKNWILKPDNSCQASKKYSGNCIRNKSFLNFSDMDKKVWSEQCNVEWPCKEKNYNFQNLCPNNWIINADLKSCTAPLNYLGPCKNILYLYNLSDSEKIELMKKCNVQWSIISNKEIFNFDDLCPIGWKLIDIQTETCKAPISYNGSCKREISFANFSKEEKYDFSKRCDVRWVTINQVKQNFNNICPLNWKLINKENQICAASVEYQGPCENIISFKNYTNEMKSIWSSKCHALFINRNIITLNNKIKYIKSRSNQVGNGKNGKIVEPTFPLPLYNGPIVADKDIGYKVIPANNGNIDFIQNEEEDEIVSIDDIINDNKTNIIINDDKINDLLLLKESSNDQEFKKTIDKTIEDLKKRYFKTNNQDNEYSFIQYDNGSSSSSSSSSSTISADLKVSTDDINYIKNLYKNYKIERENEYRNEKRICSEKDYTKCPIGWFKINDKECLAPKSYIKNKKRKCNSILDIGNLNKKVYDVSHDIYFDMIDIDRRKQLEKECNVEFPCVECERDYIHTLCPVDWKQLDNNLCQAPSNYSKELQKVCGNIVNFNFVSPEFKKHWSFVCKADWPCYSLCEKDYSTICPNNYKLINQRKEFNQTIYTCINNDIKNNADDTNTNSRSSDCKVIEILDSIILKKKIEEKCNVNWPCAKKCKENYYQTCPYNWLFENDKCYAPSYYKGPKNCSNVIENVLSFTNSDKFNYGNKCFVSWPCQNSCQSDFTQLCPSNWRKVRVSKDQKVVTEVEIEPEVETEAEAEPETEEVEIEKEVEKEEVDHAQIETAPKKPYRITEILNHIDKIIEHKEEYIYSCKPPKNYIGNCNDKYYDFENFTFFQKQDFQFRCNVKWPCGQNVHNTQNWQTRNIYTDQNFKSFDLFKNYE